MNKIAIFTEGQTELIFVRYLLLLCFNQNEISFECFQLKSHNYSLIRYSYNNAYAKHHFLLINVGNDETVMSTIKEQEINLINEGYHRIIGLRDMYSQKYKELSSVINNVVTQKFIDYKNSEIQSMSNPDKIFVCFAIMEIEAWLLGMYKIFSKIDCSLTSDYIYQKLNYDITKIDPENFFFKPSSNLADILLLCNINYTKSWDDAECICSHISDDDILDITENGRCSSFNIFFNLLP